MVTKFTVVVDCADPARLTRFWAEALGYRVEGPPAGFDTWRAFWKSQRVPDEMTSEGDDRLSDPAGTGPRFWFHKVEERKSVKNRLHVDLNVSGGSDVAREQRVERVEAAAERLVQLGAARLGILEGAGPEHYAVEMLDPEGNEFDVN